MASSLSWEDNSTGPRHAVEWTSICKSEFSLRNFEPCR